MKKQFTLRPSLLTILCSLFTIHCSLFTLFAQDQHYIDSLQTLLKTAKQDTNKANILFQITKVYSLINPNKAMDYAKQTLAFSEKIEYKMGIGKAYNIMGIINNNKGDYLQALEFYKKALKIREEIGDKQGIANSINNLGITFMYQGNYPEALKYELAALKISEDLADKIGIARSYNNIGSIYLKQGNYPEALKIFLAALKIEEKNENKYSKISLYNSIGSVYYAQANYPQALRNFLEALKMCEILADKKGISATYNNMGAIYSIQGNYPEALKNHFASLKIREETGDKQGTSASYNNIGKIYTKQKKYNDARRYLNKGLSISKEISSLEDTKDSYSYLAILDSSQGNFKQALEHYKLFITYRDSIYNEENTKKITQQQMQYDFDKKEAATKAEQDKKDALAIKELQKQKLVRNGFVGGFSIVLLFAIVFFAQRIRISKEKKRSEALLLNILPSEVAEELKAKGSALAKQFDDVTVIFTDFKGFTQIAEKLTPVELVTEIDICFKAFDNIMGKYNIEKIKTIGDSYMAAGGLPVPNKTNAADVVGAALEIQKFMLDYCQNKKNEGKEIFEIRIGVHTGPVVAGIVGVKKFAYDIWGDTVNIASRMESSGEAGKVNISGSTYEIVKNTFACTYRGKIEAKNKGMIDMYFVESI